MHSTLDKAYWMVAGGMSLIALTIILIGCLK